MPIPDAPDWELLLDLVADLLVEDMGPRPPETTPMSQAFPGCDAKYRGAAGSTPQQAHQASEPEVSAANGY